MYRILSATKLQRNKKQISKISHYTQLKNISIFNNFDKLMILCKVQD